MKILYLTTESYFKAPIIKSQVITLLKNIFFNNHEVQFTLLTFEDIKDNIEYQAHSVSGLSHVLRKNKGHLSNILWVIYYALLNAKKFDIIHVRSYAPMIAALIAKLFFGTKVIFDPRGLYSEELSYFEDRKIMSKLFKVLERVCCKYSDEIVVVSRPFKEYLVDRYNLSPNRVHVISTFAISKDDIEMPENLTQIKRDIFNNENVLLFVYSGSIENWQLIREIVLFFSLVKKEIANSRFIFFSQAKEKFEEYLKDKLPKDSYYVKSVDGQLLSWYLSQGDFGVLFRDNHIINKVSAPIKVKDYLLSGLPIVISQGIGDSSEFVAKNNFGLVMENLSEKEMLNKIEMFKNNSLVFNKDLMVALTKEHFHVDIVGKKYEQLYKKTLTSRL